MKNNESWIFTDEIRMIQTSQARIIKSCEFHSPASKRSGLTIKIKIKSKQMKN
jgi:hypothetical protein